MPGTTPPQNDRPRLTEEQKKENHIRSEQKRREAIREGFDRLASIVPGIEGQGRSEAIVLNHTISYTHQEVLERRKLIKAAQAKGINTDGWELPEPVEKVTKAQMARGPSKASSA